jgi:2-phospho-L-lactate guanylyltransferase
MIAALVPVKRLGAGKSRLLGSIPRDAIERLTLAMLGDILDALARVPHIDRIAVVTPDRVVGAAAEAAGAEALVRSDPGLNPSLDAAGAELAERGAARLLVVLGDVAGAEAADLASLFDALDGLGGRGVVLAPSRDGGTSALLRAPHDAIPNHFGKESAAAHRDLARSRGVPYSELPLPSLAVDLDRADDAEALLRAERGAVRTRALLRELGFGGSA